MHAPAMRRNRRSRKARALTLATQQAGKKLRWLVYAASTQGVGQSSTTHEMTSQNNRKIVLSDWEANSNL